jgi:hypothetical protein
MKGTHMNIKSLLIAMSITPSVFSATELLSSDSMDASPLIKFIKEIPNSFNALSKEDLSNLKILIDEYLNGTKNVEELNEYIKSLKVEIYELVDDEEVEKTKARHESFCDFLAPILNNYVKSLQEEFYELVDQDNFTEAKNRYDSTIALLDPLYKYLHNEELGAGEETLGLMAQYIDDHEELTHIYRKKINTTPVDQ